VSQEVPRPLASTFNAGFLNKKDESSSSGSDYIEEVFEEESEMKKTENATPAPDHFVETPLMRAENDDTPFKESEWK